MLFSPSIIPPFSPPVYDSGATPRSPEAVQFQVSVWVRGPLTAKCPIAHPPQDLNREPQTLPVGTPRSPLPFMPSHHVVCTLKSSPWGPPNLHHGDAPHPELKLPGMLQAFNTPRLYGQATYWDHSGNPRHHPQGTQMSQSQLPKIYTTPQSQPPSPGQPPTHYTMPSSPQACWDPMVTLLSLCPQVSPGDSEGLTYAQLQAVTPSTHPPDSSTTPEPSIIYTEVGTRGPR